jgi:broad specificity phosphatase PhoE
MVRIIFESHSTSEDNEAERSSGRFDAELSTLGKQQAKELGQRYQDQKLDAVFCSDLRRSFETAKLAFGKSDTPIIKDRRLSEIDYGDLTRNPSKVVEKAKIEHIKISFPDGESYVQTTEKVKEFLFEVKNDRDEQTVMIIGHRATQYALENLINGIDLKKAVTSPWSWQPGWTYELNMLK